MIPVLSCPVGIYVIIARAFVLVTIIGLTFGLFIVPATLGSLPQSLFGKNFFITKEKDEDVKNTDGAQNVDNNFDNKMS